MNSQDNRQQSSENPTLIDHGPYKKLWLMCGVIWMQLPLLGPFYSETIKSNQSDKDILTPFLKHLSDYDFLRKTMHNLTPHNYMHCLQCFWWANNKPGIVASLFARSEPVQFYL